MLLGILIGVHCMGAIAAFFFMLIADRIIGGFGRALGWTDGKQDSAVKIALMACVWEIFLLGTLGQIIQEHYLEWKSR